MIFKPSIFTKIYLSSLTIILCTALFIGLRSDRILQDNFVSQMKSSLEEKLDRAEVKLRPGLLRESILEIRDATSEFAQSENVGVTVFDWKGSILADSRDDINNYDNQPIRKEVHQVLKEDYSFHIRFSPPMDSRAMFIARKQEEVHETIGSIRLSSSLAPLAKKSMSLLMEIAAITLVIGLFAIVPSAFVSWFLTKPINFLRRRAEGFNLKRIRKDNSIHRRDEIGELARAQDEMAEKFQNALNETSHEKELSSSILSAMLEGVIALDTRNVSPT